MSNKQKECYWDKSIDMSKATLQVDGKVVCKFDNDNQTIIVNEGFKTLRELELEARVKDLEERIMNHSNTVEEYCSRLANKEKEYEELKRKVELMMDCADCKVDDYKQALEEIEEIIKNDFRDDYKVGGVLTLIDSYLTENGEFVDERGDFLKAFEDLLDKEHSSDNKTLSISRQILDIINKAKGKDK